MNARRLVLVGIAVAAALAARQVSGAAREGEVSRGFDPFGGLFTAGYAAQGALGMGLAMQLSDLGLAAIARHEALRLAPYRDEAGHWTVGYGHKLGPLDPLEEITQARALELLHADAAEAVAAVNALVAVPLSQEQFDALVSFVFNVGQGAFRGSTLLARLNDGDYSAAAAQFMVWNKVTDPASGQKRVSAGLLARRDAEARLFAGVA